MQSKPARSISSQVAASLRTTAGASPFTTAISWYRLKVNESWLLTSSARIPGRQGL